MSLLNSGGNSGASSPKERAQAQKAKPHPNDAVTAGAQGAHSGDPGLEEDLLCEDPVGAQQPRGCAPLPRGTGAERSARARRAPLTVATTPGLETQSREIRRTLRTFTYIFQEFLLAKLFFSFPNSQDPSRVSQCAITVVWGTVKL